jgi:hypothetical protein
LKLCKEDYMLANIYIIQHMLGQLLDGLDETIFKERRELMECILEGVEIIIRRMKMDYDEVKGE